MNETQTAEQLIRLETERMKRDAAQGEPSKRYNRTDIGNAERLVDAHGKDLRFCHPFKRWYVWNGKCWGDDNTGELKRRCKDVVRRMYSEANVAPMSFGISFMHTSAIFFISRQFNF